MHKSDSRIDAYISKAAPFAKPILESLRDTIHSASPDIMETIKWGFPHFMYKDKILCSMASFKQHCAFTFWNGKNMTDPYGILEQVGRTAMGHLGRIESIDQLPDKEILIKYIQAAMAMDIAQQMKTARSQSAAKVPADFQSAMEANTKALGFFESMNNSNKRDYTEWIEEAKTDRTRQKRITESVVWLSEGKIRNRKYIK